MFHPTASAPPDARPLGRASFSAEAVGSSSALGCVSLFTYSPPWGGQFLVSERGSLLHERLHARPFPTKVWPSTLMT
jgi:hypothetical protein